MSDKEDLIKCTQQILGLAENVYLELGSGYKEDTYQKALAINFRKQKIKYFIHLLDLHRQIESLL